MNKPEDEFTPQNSGGTVSDHPTASPESHANRRAAFRCRGQ